MQIIPLLLAGITALGLYGCGESEEAIQLRGLQDDMLLANATIDSLNYHVEASNLLIDELRARADSLQHVDDKLLQSVQRLNKEVGKWKRLAGERQRKNEQLTTEINRLKQEKIADQQALARIRSESDSLNTALLEAATSIRRQSDHIQRLEVSLAERDDQLDKLKRAQTSVRVLVAGENFLKENGYLKVSRPFGRGFRKNYKLIKKLESDNPMVRNVPIGDATLVESKLMELVDRYGKLKEGDDFDESKEEGKTRITFFNELLAGVDVLAVVED